MIETLLADLRFGLRSLRNSPGFTLVAVFALALGIGANTAIFSVVNDVLLKPLPYREPDRLMNVWENNLRQGWHKDVVTPADFVDWRSQNRSFESMAAYTGRGFNLSGATEPERVSGAIVSLDFFRVLGRPPVAGRDFQDGDERSGSGRVAVVSDALWRTRFGGDPHLIGRSITLNSESFTIIGIAAPGFQFPEEAEVWGLAKHIVPENPWGQTEPDITTLRGMHYFPVIARLKPGVDVAQAQAEMDTIAARLAKQYPDSNGDTGVEVIPLHESMVGDVRPALLIFLGAVGLVLLIACANVANMSLARSAARGREVAIRTALGATRLRLARQHLTESVLLALLGGGAGLLLALWGRDLLASLAPGSIPGPTAVAIDTRVLGFSFALSMLTGLLFGVVPALYSAGSDPQDALRESGRTSTAGPRARFLRSALVVAEMAVALVLLTGAGLLMKSFLRLQRIDPGLRIDRVTALKLWIPDVRYADDERKAQFYGEVLRRVQTLPGVEVAGATSDLPMSGSDTNLGFVIEGRPALPPTQEPYTGLHQVSPDYFRAMGIPLLRGRLFTERERRGTPDAVIIGDTLARRFWTGEDPLGHRVSFGFNEKGERSWYTVIGVVGDVRQRGLQETLRPEVYIAYAQWPSRYMTLVVRSPLEPAAIAAAVRREVLAVDGEVPVYGVQSMREVLDGSLETQRFDMALLALFAGVALALAAVGLYGVLAYVVTQRTHEIGLRMALGARRLDVLRLVVGQGMCLALLGVLAGLLGALGLTRVLSSLLVGVAATDPSTLGLTAALLTAVALIACGVPALRASRVDPMVALRHE